MYVIKGKYPASDWENIDEFATLEEAEKMLAEYRMAYGSEWQLTIKKPNEYEKLVQAEKTCHTIEVREKATGKEGVANTCEHGVQVFYGAHDGSDDKTVTPEVFSRDFEITAEIASMEAGMKPEDYTIEYCPFCDREVAIRSHGITACPSCGKPLAPCSVCLDEKAGCYADLRGCQQELCPYGCTGGAEDEFIPITNPPMTEEEVAFAEANC